MEINISELNFFEEVEGKKIEYSMVETWDGLYTPVAIRKPSGEGPFRLFSWPLGMVVRACHGSWMR